MKIKERFPLTERLVYFDNAVMGCLPESTIDVMRDYNAALLDHVSGEREWGFNVVEGKNSKEEAVELFAEVIGAKCNEVCCVPNASTGMNIAMSMIPIKRGDNVVSTDLTFPMGMALVRKAMERGAKARWLSSRNGVVETDAFRKAIDDNTAIVYVDQPTWFNGYLFDLEALADLAHSHGALLVVDATQSMGGINWEIDETGVDFAATSTYKWLLGGIPAHSTGFMYMREEHIDRYDPVYVSGGTYEYEKIGAEGLYMRYKFALKDGIDKYHVSRAPDITFKAVANSMRVLLDHGMENIEAQNRKLTTYLVDGLLERGYVVQGHEDVDKHCYLNVKVGDVGRVVEEMKADDYWCAERVGGIRISPHFYNTIEEADLFLDKLDEVV